MSECVPPIAGYQAQVEIFLKNVAADSRRPTSVYGLSGQYRDSRGPAAYNSRYVGDVLSTDPLPANDCTEPALTVDHCLLLDVTRERLQETHQEPCAERNRERRIDEHEREPRVLQPKFGDHA